MLPLVYFFLPRDLSENEFNLIPKNLLAVTENVTSINLQRNSITAIEDDTFIANPSLETMYGARIIFWWGSTLIKLNPCPCYIAATSGTTG